jgi:hypothetical protein
MCPKCEAFAERVEIENQADLFHRIDEIRQILRQGALVSTDGNCSLADIQPGSQWPGDIIEHAFRCVACEQRFELWVDTYHGHGNWHAA